MANSHKILVCGDVDGNFKQLFTRVASVQKKAGPFESLFCVGEFFGEDNSEWEPFASGEKKVPISTYVLGPTQASHLRYYEDKNGCDMCENVTYLGHKGLYTAGSGLQIAYLSGRECDNTPNNAQFSPHDLEALKVICKMSDSKYKGVDILLTSQWPRGVDKYVTSVEGVNTLEVGSSVIAQVALDLRPHYHFSGLEGVFYERQPYRNHQILGEKPRHVTRFLALAKVGNPQKRKFLYAFNIVPMKHLNEKELCKQPPDVTECPFKYNESLCELGQDEKSAQFFYDSKALQKKQNKRKSGDQGGGQAKKHAQPPGPCWFCLGSPEVEKHLVVSVGTQCYIALAKGGLIPEHVLIAPIGHHQSVVTAPDDVIEEIEQYKSSLKKFFKSRNQEVVFFERNYKTAHLQVQAVPIPSTQKDEVKETFVGLALCQNIELAEIPKHSVLKQIVPSGAPYFYAETPNGERLLYRITKGFPLQFGREAMADQTLLNMPDKVDWRNCKSSKPEETDMANNFRKTFEKFDFNLL